MEIARLRWSWIDFDQKRVTLPDTVTKNKREHTFPLGAEAEAVLRSAPRLSDTYVFPAAHKTSETTTTFNSFSKAKARLDKDTETSGWTLHDLRRTVSTGMAELGIPQQHVEKLLNHVSGGTQSTIAQVYNRYQFLPEMREAVDRWENKVQALVAGKQPDVATLR